MTNNPSRDLSYIIAVLKEELVLSPERAVNAGDRLSDLGAEDTDYVSILDSVGIKPFLRYFDAGADKLTQEGEEAFQEIGEKFSTELRKARAQGLQAMMKSMSVSDIRALCLYADSKN